MIATIEQIKKAEHMHRCNEDGIEKISFTLHGTDRRNAHEDLVIGKTLLDLTINQLKHEGLNVSNKHANFSLWPCWKHDTNEEYTLLVVCIATTDEGKKEMMELIER